MDIHAKVKLQWSLQIKYVLHGLEIIAGLKYWLPFIFERKRSRCGISYFCLPRTRATENVFRIPFSPHLARQEDQRVQF